MDDIKWGIVGPGKIAAKFAQDLNLIGDAVIEAVASRNIDRASEFAKEFGAKYVYGSYEELFASDVVDIVYIATPHVFHKDLAIMAMNNGKHVLCEKPLGINTSEVNEMLKAANENEVFLMEALWSKFHPALKDVLFQISEGVLGKVRYVNADFAFYAMNRDKESRLLNPSLAGGSLLDIGIYPVFLAYTLLGMPNNILANAILSENGLETQVAILMNYDNAQAVLYSGFTHNSRMSAEIAGTKGNIYLDSRWHAANGYSLVIDEKTNRIDLPKKGNGYTHEIEEVNKCLKNGKLESDSWSHQDSLNLISLLDEIRKLTGIQFPFEEHR